MFAISEHTVCLLLLEELEDHFHNLETQLADQVNVMKTILLNIEEKITDMDKNLKNNNRKHMSSLRSICHHERYMREKFNICSNY